MKKNENPFFSVSAPAQVPTGNGGYFCIHCFYSFSGKGHESQVKVINRFESNPIYLKREYQNRICVGCTKWEQAVSQVLKFEIDMSNLFSAYWNEVLIQTRSSIDKLETLSKEEEIKLMKSMFNFLNIKDPKDASFAQMYYLCYHCYKFELGSGNDPKLGTINKIENNQMYIKKSLQERICNDCAIIENTIITKGATIPDEFNYYWTEINNNKHKLLI